MDDATAPTAPLCMVPDCGMEAAPSRRPWAPEALRACYFHGDRFVASWDSKPLPDRYIYVARKPGDGPPDEVKIGTTDDLTRRMKQLGLVPMQVFKGGFEDERELHGWLRRDRVRGEWFRYTEHVQQTLRDWDVLGTLEVSVDRAINEPELARFGWRMRRHWEAVDRYEAHQAALAASEVPSP